MPQYRTHRSSVTAASGDHRLQSKPKSTKPACKMSNEPQRDAKITAKIPKSVRFDLEKALVGLCNVWFEDIKPHLVANNIKLHVHGDAEVSSDAADEPAVCSHLDPGAADCPPPGDASSADYCTTLRTALSERSHRPLAPPPSLRRPVVRPSLMSMNQHRTCDVVPELAPCEPRPRLRRGQTPPRRSQTPPRRGQTQLTPCNSPTKQPLSPKKLLENLAQENADQHRTCEVVPEQAPNEPRPQHCQGETPPRRCQTPPRRGHKAQVPPSNPAPLQPLSPQKVLENLAQENAIRKRKRQKKKPKPNVSHKATQTDDLPIVPPILNLQRKRRPRNVASPPRRCSPEGRLSCSPVQRVPRNVPRAKHSESAPLIENNVDGDCLETQENYNLTMFGKKSDTKVMSLNPSALYRPSNLTKRKSRFRKKLHIFI